MVKFIDEQFNELILLQKIVHTPIHRKFVHSMNIRFLLNYVCL